MRNLTLTLALAPALLCSGCRSAFMEATIANQTTEPLSLVEVDYPSASFGTQTLMPGQVFHYRFKILGSGPTTLLWTDAGHHDHKNSGPSLHEGEEGAISIVFAPAPIWKMDLKDR